MVPPSANTTTTHSPDMAHCRQVAVIFGLISLFLPLMAKDEDDKWPYVVEKLTFGGE